MLNTKLLLSPSNFRSKSCLPQTIHPLGNRWTNKIPFRWCSRWKGNSCKTSWAGLLMIFSQGWKEEASWIEGASSAKLFLMIVSVDVKTSSTKGFQVVLIWTLILLTWMQTLKSRGSQGGVKNLDFKDGISHITASRMKTAMRSFSPSLGRLSSSHNKKVLGWQERSMMYEYLMALESLK